MPLSPLHRVEVGRGTVWLKKTSQQPELVMLNLLCRLFLLFVTLFTWAV